MKDANWEFTKELCLELGEIDNPSKELSNLATKFMIILGQKEYSWKLFKSLTKNYGPLKNQMDSLNIDYMSESKLTELLPFWKNYSTLSATLQKEAKGAEVILRWMASAVEFKLKKEAFADSKSKLSEVLC